ncbi:MAG: LacI family DNA-binding transcriptional regulator [Propionicimonas sp.]|uniref:LacI family DNA-binding transcriptional regulator n=1 Tax=Propionicimonas sp. TaxID=1955623 RepID=UPI003D106E22
MVTITDVARYAGVSVSTVSYALSGSRPVRPETRARVRAAMRELGYRPSTSAQSLASRRRGVLALLYPMVDRGVGGTGGEFVQGIAGRARDLGYQLVVWPFRSSDRREVLELLGRGMADGVVVMEVEAGDARVQALEAAGVPYVMVGRTTDAEDRPSIDIDIAAALVDAVDLLAGLGHTEIAFLGHSSASLAAGYGPSARAAAAYTAQLAARGLRPLLLPCEDSPEAGRRAAAALLSAEPAVTAVITMNELATFGLLAGLRSGGVAVPERMSVLGVVTSPGVGALSEPPLTTLHAMGEQVGALAVDRLVCQLDPDADPAPNRLVRCVLVPGGSVAPAPVLG